MSQTYPLVNELELQVALPTVWVGLSARLQRVPLILPAAQVLAGQAGRTGGQEALTPVRADREAAGGRPQARLGVALEPLP